MEKANSVAYKVYGSYALFTDPLTKIGGERFSYQIPTYQALKGITEGIYWKPTIQWYIDEVRIMNSIQTQSKGIRPIHYHDNGNDLSIYTYLYDVEYQVKAHFEWNENRRDLVQDRNENKHFDVAKRMIRRGGRRDIFLGTRECQGYVEPCEYGSGESFYDEISMPFSLMLHGITYPDETVSGNKEAMQVRFWVPEMKNGCIKFIRPEECPVVRNVGTRSIKQFNSDNFIGLQEFEKAGVFDGMD